MEAEGFPASCHWSSDLLLAEEEGRGLLLNPRGCLNPSSHPHHEWKRLVCWNLSRMAAQLEKPISSIWAGVQSLRLQPRTALSLTSVPMSFIRASASSLRLPCSTPELTSGMGMSLMGGRGWSGKTYTKSIIRRTILTILPFLLYYWTRNLTFPVSSF